MYSTSQVINILLSPHCDHFYIFFIKPLSYQWVLFYFFVIGFRGEAKADTHLTMLIRKPSISQVLGLYT